MRYLYLLLTALCVVSSCVSAAKDSGEEAIGVEVKMRDDFAKISFLNLSNEDLYLRLRRGNAEQNIGILNHDENGRPQRTSSLIPSGQSRTYIISPNRYAIVLKKDENGRIDAESNRYEEFYFPASSEVYELHLFPARQRNTSVTILSPDSTENNKRLSLNPSFNIYFSDDMLRPIVEQNIELVDENKNPLPVTIQWQSKRHLTLKPRESLRPSCVYTVIVQLEARNVEAERLTQMGEAVFSTGDTVELVSTIDTTSFRFDFSVPGTIRLDWTLPAGANGSEMRIRDGKTTDLQAKTNYTFSIGEIDSAAYKIVPYKLISGRKAYNQAALDGSFKNIPRAALYGLTYKVLANTPHSVEIGFSFTKKLPNGFEFILSAKGEKTALNAGNNFTYKTFSPPRIPGEKLVYSLMIDGYADDYIFALQRPGDAEFYAVFEQTALADMNVIAEKIRAYQQSPVSFDKENKTINALYQEYAGYVYPSAHNIDEYKKRVKTNAVFAEIERLYNEASQTQMTRNEQFAAAAEGERRKREAAAESARKAKEWQESNHNLFVLDVFIPFGAGTVGIGEEMGLYFSPVRYITLGGSGFLFAASNLETLCGGGLFSAGLVLPLSSSENRMEVFADGFLSAASLPHPGLISKQVSPGFTGGIRYVSTWIGFEIKYRGFRLANDYHLHAISGGMVVLW